MANRSLNQLSGVPQVGAAFDGWQMPISLTKRVQTVTNGIVGYVDSAINFRGIIQPLSPQQLALKPEGQRSWDWLQIHCRPGTLNLTTNDQIVYNSLIFKVMAINDYSLNGFIEYHVVIEYQP